VCRTFFLESLDMQDQNALVINKRYGLERRQMQTNGSGDRRKMQSMLSEENRRASM
jgi:hypothetical protein